MLRNESRNQLITATLFGALNCFYFGNFVIAQAPPLPKGPLSEWIQLGEDIVENTVEHPLSKEYVGNRLNCRSCHLDNGKHPTAGSFLETATAYPAWSPREETVITLEDRVLNCFMRSCNGQRPPVGSKISIALTTYITWLSQGEEMKMNEERPVGPREVPLLEVKADKGDLARGNSLYQERCADCHGMDGFGDSDNPPVWGPESYNAGAGLASVDRLADWLHVALPLGEANLTPQESVDIATFVNSHDRPAFRLEEHLPSPEKRGEYNGKLP